MKRRGFIKRALGIGAIAAMSGGVATGRVGEKLLTQETERLERENKNLQTVHLTPVKMEDSSLFKNYSLETEYESSPSPLFPKHNPENPCRESKAQQDELQEIMEAWDNPDIFCGSGTIPVCSAPSGIMGSGRLHSTMEYDYVPMPRDGS